MAVQSLGFTEFGSSSICVFVKDAQAVIDSDSLLMFTSNKPYGDT